MGLGFAPLFIGGTGETIAWLGALQANIESTHSVLAGSEQERCSQMVDYVVRGDMSLTEGICQLVTCLQEDYAASLDKTHTVSDRRLLSEWLPQPLPMDHWLTRFTYKHSTVRQVGQDGEIEEIPIGRLPVTRFRMSLDESVDFKNYFRAYHELAYRAGRLLGPFIDFPGRVGSTDEQHIESWFLIPPPLLLGALGCWYGESAYTLVPTLEMSSLDEMRSLVTEHRRPLCLDTCPPKTKVHGNKANHPYGILLHDLIHTLMLSHLARTHPEIPDDLLILEETARSVLTADSPLLSHARETMLDGPVYGSSALDGTGAFRYSPFELLFRSLFLTIRTYAPNWRQERNFAVHFSRALMDVETWPVEKREHILACFQRHFGRKRYLYI